MVAMGDSPCAMGWWAASCTSRYAREERIARERAEELLSIFHMERHADERAGSLPYGAQRRLEILRALASNPCLLLLDEPAAGMNPSGDGGADGRTSAGYGIRFRSPCCSLSMT